MSDGIGVRLRKEWRQLDIERANAILDRLNRVSNGERTTRWGTPLFRDRPDEVEDAIKALYMASWMR
jgi:hypothetical protein